MADIYALLKWQPALAANAPPPGGAVRIGIIGVPSRMRTVRSLLILLSRFSGGIGEVVVVTDDPGQAFDDGQRETLEQAGLRLRVTSELDSELPRLDVVYINAIAWVGDSFEAHGVRFGLSRSSPLKPGAIVLHPLARGEELDRDLDDTPHNWYFAQARGAVFIRMALLAAMLKSFQ
jgi:aspartate carbamoyltransferase catalytic subunit